MVLKAFTRFPFRRPNAIITQDCISGVEVAAWRWEPTTGVTESTPFWPKGKSKEKGVIPLYPASRDLSHQASPLRVV